MTSVLGCSARDPFESKKKSSHVISRIDESERRNQQNEPPQHNAFLALLPDPSQPQFGDTTFLVRAKCLDDIVSAGQVGKLSRVRNARDEKAFEGGEDLRAR